MKLAFVTNGTTYGPADLVKEYSIAGAHLVLIRGKKLTGIASTFSRASSIRDEADATSTS